MDNSTVTRVKLKGSLIIIIIASCNITDMRSFDISNDRLGVLHGLTQDSAPSPTRNPVSDPSQEPQSSPQYPLTSSDTRTAEAGGRKGAERRSKSKFRFKKNDRLDREEDEGRDRHHHHHDAASRPSKRPRHNHHANKVKDDPTAYDDTYIPNAASFRYTNSDDAFRESLFDAMADDEGAAFWEGVYGQPINVYSRPEVRDERGKLEMMDDEQYAKYVREKMWEKSHQHIIEERAKREGERKKTKERKILDEETRKQWEKTQLGEDKRRSERKVRNRLQKRWEEYLENWAIIMEGTRVDVGKMGKASIPWPVESGELSDITRETVEKFLLSAPTGTGYQGGDFINILKLERVRWHPDKAQQRWGRGGLGEEELKGITAVFQVIDSLWIEYRGKEYEQT